jgi:hypothetical protein
VHGRRASWPPARRLPGAPASLRRLCDGRAGRGSAGRGPDRLPSTVFRARTQARRPSAGSAAPWEFPTHRRRRSVPNQERGREGPGSRSSIACAGPTRRSTSALRGRSSPASGPSRAARPGAASYPDLAPFGRPPWSNLVAARPAAPRRFDRPRGSTSSPPMAVRTRDWSFRSDRLCASREAILEPGSAEEELG